MGAGIGSIETAIRELFMHADQEILATAYSVGSAVDVIFDVLDQALSRGVLIRMVINKYEAQPAVVRTHFSRLRIRYPHFHLYDFVSTDEEDLHAKVLIVDRTTALV